MKKNELRVQCPNVINEAFYDGLKTSFHFDVFFILMAKLKGKTSAVITFDEIKALYTRRSWHSNEEFESNLTKVCNDILYSGIIPVKWNDDYEGAICLYAECAASRKKKDIRVKVNSEYIRFFVENLWAERILFTPFSINVYVSLKSLYSKRLYRRLLQYRTSNNPFFLTDEIFRKTFKVPQSYDYHNIKQKIIDPAIKAIMAADENIKNLKCTAIRHGGAHGKLIGYEFTFDWLGKNKNLRSYREKIDKLIDNIRDQSTRSMYFSYSRCICDTLEYWEGSKKTKPETRMEMFYKSIEREHKVFLRENKGADTDILHQIDDMAIESATFLEKV